ncbi:PREDICTED: dehydrodolichyl diphosphate syntase complex subunit DHDDS-like [Vollenhovia emeryi]|uniref:dehydrodolichyl diphosphate syntase complex subunit DHDDS-like n=1 Tax=Vollenhovia emeryi TaxID=411798 RepID=UPI0005F36F50|nr:PREDICTED: dehydrodolichyl diphosphate syntase complex subunit DHDDS-like [Vollenhovia emeryi]
MSWLMNNIRDWFLSLVVRILKTGPIPGHVALVLDGNRRYAQKYNMLTGEGHLKGNEKLTDTISWCIALGVTEMTVFAFSIENFRRSKEEIDGLMNLARQTFKEMLLLEQRLIAADRSPKARVKSRPPHTLPLTDSFTPSTNQNINIQGGYNRN